MGQILIKFQKSCPEFSHTIQMTGIIFQNCISLDKTNTLQVGMVILGYLCLTHHPGNLRNCYLIEPIYKKYDILGSLI